MLRKIFKRIRPAKAERVARRWVAESGRVPKPLYRFVQTVQPQLAMAVDGLSRTARRRLAFYEFPHWRFGDGSDGRHIRRKLGRQIRESLVKVTGRATMEAWSL